MTVGSVRTLRDYVESGGTVFHTIFNYTLGNYSSSSVTLVRHWINGTTTQYLTFDAVSNAAFNVTPSSNVTLPATINMIRPGGNGSAILQFTSSFNFTSTTPSTPFVQLEGLGRQSIFLTQTPANGTAVLTNVLGAIQNNGSAIANQVALLAYSDRFLAGGWRFLTYFGRYVI